MGKMYVLLLLLCSALLRAETITAVMITGKDRFHHAFANLAIRSFLEQSYPDKQLLIINDGEQESSFSAEDPISEIRVEKGLTLGELRNVALEKIPENAVWVQWDDDDWHHPRLLEEQYKFLTAKRVDLCYLRNQVQYAFQIDAAWTVHRMILGTIMCRKKKGILYPPLARGEDSTFFFDYCKKYKATGWNNPAYYYLRFIHGHNTWGDDFFKLHEKTAHEWNIDAASSKYLSAILPLYPHQNYLRRS